MLNGLISDSDIFLLSAYLRYIYQRYIYILTVKNLFDYDIVR